MPRTGEVYYLPPLEGEGGQVEGKGDRPFVLLGESAADGVATLAYCSTRETESRHGAASVWIDPAAAGNAGCGFSRPSYVYLSRLTSYVTATLGRPAGRIVSQLPDLRRELGIALGFGTGVCTQKDLPRGNLRGSVILLTKEFAAMTGYPHAVIVTEPVPSRERRQQTIVPLLSPGEFEESAHDVMVRDEPWISEAVPGQRAALLAPALVTTVFEPDFLDVYTGAAVDPVTMERIEAALRLHFDLAADTDQER